MIIQVYLRKILRLSDETKLLESLYEIHVCVKINEWANKLYSFTLAIIIAEVVLYSKLIKMCFNAQESMRRIDSSYSGGFPPKVGLLSL